MEKELEIIERLINEVNEYEAGIKLDEAIGTIVLKYIKSPLLAPLKHPQTGKVVAQTPWKTKEGVPVMLPPVSINPTIAQLFLFNEKKNATIDFVAEEGKFVISFIDSLDVPISGKTFEEAVAKAILFEALAKDEGL